MLLANVLAYQQRFRVATPWLPPLSQLMADLRSAATLRHDGYLYSNFPVAGTRQRFFAGTPRLLAYKTVFIRKSVKGDWCADLQSSKYARGPRRVTADDELIPSGETCARSDWSGGFISRRMLACWQKWAGTAGWSLASA